MVSPEISRDTTRLESLLESAQLLHSSLDLTDLLRHLLRSAMGRTLATRGLIAVEERGTLRIALARGTKRFQTGELFDAAAAREAGLSSMLPIGEEDHPVGMLCLGLPAAGKIDPAEEEALRALLGIAAGGITNARAHQHAQQLNQDLAQKVQELRALLDLVRGLSATLEPEAVANLLMLTLAGRWAVRKYALAVKKEGHPIALRQRGLALPDIETYQNMLGEMPEAIRLADLAEGALKDSLARQGAAVLFPLRSSESTYGLIAIGARPGNVPYSDADLEFGAGLAAQAGVAFENAWYVRETLERKKIEQELELAASIQEKLFPDALPILTGYDIAARNLPARQCGGDYFDALPRDETSDVPRELRSHLFCVADVSGKGLPASLLMSNMQATLRALIGHMPSLVELAARTSGLLYATTPSNKFVTAILLEVNPATGECRYVNAGHNDCFLMRRKSGEVERLTSTGLPLGMLPGMQYEEKNFRLETGDVLALYSDGVPEAYDEAENEWGEERLIDCLRHGGDDATAQGIVSHIFTSIENFVGTAPQHDDITLMVLKHRN